MHLKPNVLITFLCLKLVKGSAINNFRNVDPFTPGDLPVNHTVIYNALSISTDTNIGVYAPNAPGNYPVFYFITGLAGISQNTDYLTEAFNT